MRWLLYAKSEPGRVIRTVCSVTQHHMSVSGQSSRNKAAWRFRWHPDGELSSHWPGWWRAGFTLTPVMEGWVHTNPCDGELGLHWPRCWVVFCGASHTLWDDCVLGDTGADLGTNVHTDHAVTVTQAQIRSESMAAHENLKRNWFGRVPKWMLATTAKSPLLSLGTSRGGVARVQGTPTLWLDLTRRVIDLGQPLEVERVCGDKATGNMDRANKVYRLTGKKLQRKPKKKTHLTKRLTPLLVETRDCCVKSKVL